MKKLILIVITLFSFIASSQSLLTLKSNGSIYDINNQELKPSGVRTTCSDMPEALELYETGRLKKTVANILLWGGLAVIGGKYFADSRKKETLSIDPVTKGYVYTKDTNNFMYCVGGAMILASVPVRWGFYKKLEKSVDLMNKGLRSQPTTQVESATIIADGNGLGIAITF